MANRGQLTPTIQAAAKRLLSREITQQELRVMKFIQNKMVTKHIFAYHLFDENTRKILDDWQSRGYIENRWSSRIKCGRYFWDVMSELLWLAYADHENQPDS